jgi:putative transposase
MRWATAAIQDEALVQGALQMALLRRHSAPGLLHHSDGGLQYTSLRHQRALERIRYEYHYELNGQMV